MKSCACAVALLAACGGGNSSGGTTDDGGAVIDCASDSRVAVYKAGMSVDSASGALTFTLVESVPGPPARGNDTWTIAVKNAASAAQSALALSVLPFMPDHGHGTSVNAQIKNTGDGTYSVAPLYFFMPGVWRVTFSVASPSDSAVFFFCVPG
jgi:hypothetical protein